jgi:hypothetical protein
MLLVAALGRIRRTTRLPVAALVMLAAAPASAAASTDSLATYGTLTAGQSIVSPDGHYQFVMDPDGNLAESIVGGRALWSTHIAGDEGAHALMQPGGNLVIYNPAGAAVWSSNSSSTGCPMLVIQNDGNVIVYSPRAIWSTHTVQTVMEPGDALRPGWSIYSPNEHFQLIMLTDGDLVLYDGAGKALWSTGTQGHPGAYAVLEPDGDLVVYPSTGPALWSSKTYKDAGAYLSLSSDGNLALYKGSKVVWSTKTYGKGTGGSVGPARPAPVTSCPAPALPPPPTPVMAAPVSTPILQPAAPQQPVVPDALAVKLKISWTWSHAVTRVHGARIARFPGNAQIFVQCHGRGCPRKRDISAKGLRNVLRLVHNLRGRQFAAGDHVVIILTAPNYLPERALVEIRDGRLPAVFPLSS